MPELFLSIEKISRDYGLSEEGIEKIKKFFEILSDWNKKINLISRKNFETHFFSLTEISLWFSNFLSPFQSYIDVGSGGGFPSLIMKIFNPYSVGFLIESSLKKSSALKSMIEEIGFKGELVVLSMDFKSAIHQIMKRRIDVDIIVSMGFKKKEQLIKEIDITKKGIAFITGENEIERLRSIQNFKKFQWKIERVPERNLIKGVLIGKS